MVWFRPVLARVVFSPSRELSRLERHCSVCHWSPRAVVTYSAANHHTRLPPPFPAFPSGWWWSRGGWRPASPTPADRPRCKSWCAYTCTWPLRSLDRLRATGTSWAQRTQPPSCPWKRLRTNLKPQHENILKGCRLHWSSSFLMAQLTQESIPVGCLPPACWLCLVVLLEGGSPWRGYTLPPPKGPGTSDQDGTRDTPPPRREQIGRRLWKHYLPATTIAGGNKVGKLSVGKTSVSVSVLYLFRQKNYD